MYLSRKGDKWHKQIESANEISKLSDVIMQEEKQNMTKEDLNDKEVMEAAAEAAPYEQKTREFELDFVKSSMSVPIEGILLETGIPMQGKLLESIKGLNVLVLKDSKKEFEKFLYSEKGIENLKRILDKIPERNLPKAHYNVIIAISKKTKKEECRTYRSTTYIRIPKIEILNRSFN